jgi:protein disulfide-isomerase
MGVAHGAKLPYDERADASADIRSALNEVKGSSKDVLVVFGANWCPDCRVLDSVLHGKAAESLNEHFVLVKVDVGYLDKNVDLAKRYQIDLRKGIPAAVLLSGDERKLYTTQAGELAHCHHMGESAIVEFFARAADSATIH